MDNNYKVYYDNQIYNQHNIKLNKDDDFYEPLNCLEIEIKDISISINKVGCIKQIINSLINDNINNIQLKTNISNESEYYILYLFFKFILEKRPNSPWDIIRFNNNKYILKLGSVEFIIRNDLKNIYLSLKKPIEQIYSKRSLEEKFILNLDSFNNKYSPSKLFQTFFNLKYYFTINEPSFDVFIENFQPPLIICGVNGAGKTRLFNYFNKNHNSLKFFHTRDVIYLKDSMVLSFNEKAQILLSGFLEIYDEHSKYELNGINNHNNNSNNNSRNNDNNNYIWVQVNKMLKKYSLAFELIPSTNNCNNMEDRLVFKNDCTNLSYEELSSGEKVIFFLISLYIQYKYYIKNQHNNEKILLLMDEIESSLHARFLQTSFFKIIQEIQSVFVILLSTHNTTSLRVSALYGFNYYSIDRNRENNIIIKKIKSHENAISEVSDGMLAVVDNSKLCFVEDIDDRNFFTIAFKKIILGQKEKFRNYVKIVFIEASAQRCNIDDLRSINKQVLIINQNLDNIKQTQYHNNNSNNNDINKIESSLNKINSIVDKLKSENSAGGCSFVRKRVELLSQRDYLGEAFRLGNSQLIGLVDGDATNSVFEYVIKLEYYSLEMYFCSPLILFYVNCCNNNQEDISIEIQIQKVLEYLKSREKQVKRNETIPKWKTRLDQFYKGLENTVDVQLITGNTVQVPEVFIKGVGDGGGRGHYLFESLVRIYSLGHSLLESTKLLKDKLYEIFEYKLSINNIPKTLENSLIELMEYSTKKPFTKDNIAQTNNYNTNKNSNNNNNRNHFYKDNNISNNSLNSYNISISQ